MMASTYNWQTGVVQCISSKKESPQLSVLQNQDPISMALFLVYSSHEVQILLLITQSAELPALWNVEPENICNV